MTGDRPGLPARRAALAALRAVDEDGAYSNLAVPAAVADLAEPRDRAFASHLAYDTLRWQGTLDALLARVVDRPLDQIEPALRRLLRLGALQLTRTDVPAAAAVSTAVDLARELVPRGRSRGAAGFVNGVLRKIARSLDVAVSPDPVTDPVEHLVLHTAHPRWIVEDLVRRLGFDASKALLEADNEPPGLTLRAQGDRTALIEELRSDGLDASAGLRAPEAVRVPGADPRRLAAVTEGRATPQDEASMLVAHATRVRPGDRVLDLCAGPGGKATHLAALAGSDGRVTAVELHPHRAALVRDAAERLRLDLDVVVGDAIDPPVDSDAFDVVLLDAPCTGLGTGRRRPEVRWRRGPDDASALAALQARMLRAAAAAVRPGGHLTYAVCTWTEVETTAVTATFRSEHPDFVMVEERLLRPDVDGTDGMFVSVYQRT